jgi:hypothetical protein
MFFEHDATTGKLMNIGYVIGGRNQKSQGRVLIDGSKHHNRLTPRTMQQQLSAADAKMRPT